MKTFATYLFGLAGVLFVLYAAVSPEYGVIYRGPLAPLALGLVGIGLFRQARGTTNRACATATQRIDR